MHGLPEQYDNVGLHMLHEGSANIPCAVTNSRASWQILACSPSTGGVHAAAVQELHRVRAPHSAQHERLPQQLHTPGSQAMQ